MSTTQEINRLAERKPFEGSPLCVEIAADGFPTASKVDRQLGVIRGVKVLSPNSINAARRIGITERQVGAAANKPYGYAIEAMQEALPLYENATVYLNHLPMKVTSEGMRVAESGAARKVEDRFGRLINTRVVKGSSNPQDDGIVADLEYLKSHAHAEPIAESAERMPKALALSHIASPGGYIVRDGRVLIDQIASVQSVDLITGKPGTNRSLFESADAGDLQSIAAVDDYSNDPDSALRGALKTSLCSIIDDDSLKVGDMRRKLMDSISAIGGAMTKLEGTVAGAAAESGAEIIKVGPDVSKLQERLDALEARNKSLEAVESARVDFAAAGVESDPVLIEAYCSLGDDTKKKTYLEKLPRKPAPAGSRKVRSGAQVAESFAGDLGTVKPVADAKEFAASIAN